MNNYLNQSENKAIEKSLKTLKALHHPLRQDILKCITDNSNNINVTDIYVKLRLVQSVASSHLSWLRAAGLVKCSRLGKQVYYSVNKNEINRLKHLTSLINNS